jgi:hypothetical protein
MYSSTELKSVSGITISVPGFGFSALSELNGLQRTGRYLVGDFVQIVIREVAPNPKTRLGKFSASRRCTDVCDWRVCPRYVTFRPGWHTRRA